MRRSGVSHSSARTVLAAGKRIIVSTRCTICAHPTSIVAREYNEGLFPHPRFPLDRSGHVANGIVSKFDHGVISIRIRQISEPLQTQY